MSEENVIHANDSYWNKELEKQSLKENPFKHKLFWLKPLTMYHRFEFRGMNYI